MSTTRDASAGRRAHGAVVVVFFVHGLLFASWAAHIPQIKRSLGIDDGELGFALLGTPVGSIAAIAAASWLLPRLGSRRVVRAALVGYCAAGPLVGLAGSVAVLALTLFAWGFFQGLLDVAMNTQAIAVEGERGRRLMNGIHAWWSVGAFAGAGVGTLGVALGVGLTVQLIVVGVPVTLAAWWYAHRMLGDDAADTSADISAATSADTAADVVVPAPDTASARGSRRLSAAMLALGAVAFASMLCEGASADWSSVYLRDTLGGSAAAGGLGYTAFALATFVIRLSGDHLSARVPVSRLLGVLAGTAAVVFAVALAVPGVAFTIVAFFVLGLGLGVVVPTAFSAAGRLPGIHPGVGVAGVSGLGWAGFVCGPPLIGQLADATTLRAALVVLPVLSVAVAAGCAFVPVLRQRASDQDIADGARLSTAGRTEA